MATVAGLSSRRAGVIHSRDLRELRRTARTAGVWYLLVAVLAPLATFYLPGKLLVPGSIQQTAAHVQQHAQLLRLDVALLTVANVAMAMTDLQLYALLRDVDRGNARSMLLLLCTGLAVANANILNELGALVLAIDPTILGGLSAGTRDPLTYTLLRFFSAGNTLTTLFWGLWLLPLAALIRNSGFLPRWLAPLVFVNGIAYVLVWGTAYLAPARLSVVNRMAMPFYAAGEITLIFFLLIRGVSERSTAPSI